MFHGYYEQYQYLPIVITCAENDMVLLVGLRHGTCEASLGADNDLRYLVGRLRAVWPDVHIHVRGDSGLGVPLMYDVCRELGLSYTFGIGMNSRLRDLSDDLLKEAVADYERTGSAAAAVPRGPVSGRELGVRRSRSSSRSRRTPRGPIGGPWSRTGRAGRAVPAAVYDEYAERGESENRNKELKCELHAGRLSDHRFLANFFRLYLHAAALNLLVRLRRAVAQPAPTAAELGLPGRVAGRGARRAGPQAVLQPPPRHATRWARASPAPGGPG